MYENSSFMDELELWRLHKKIILLLGNYFSVSVTTALTLKLLLYLSNQETIQDHVVYNF